MRVRRLYCTATVLLLFVPECVFPAAAVISHVPDVRELTSSEAEQSRSVEISGVVTALSGWKNSFFLEESGTGISVDRTDTTDVHPGDRVEVSGVTGAGLFAPILVAHQVKVLGHGHLPPPRRVDYSDLAGGKQDSQWVEIHGVVRSASVSESWGRPVLFLLIDMGAGLVTARVHDFTAQNYNNFVDATVRIRGVCGTNFNERRQFVGLRLFVPELSDVAIEQTPAPDPFAVPASPVDNLFRFTVSQSANHRVKISGTVTYAQPGALYVQSGDQGIAVTTSAKIRLQPGDHVEAAGIVTQGEYSPVLEDALIRKTSAGASPKSLPLRASQVIQLENGFPFARYDGILVNLGGDVVSQSDQPTESIWYLRDGPIVFQAQLQLSRQTAAVSTIAPGSRVRVTGICAVVTDKNRDPKSFRILLRSAQDIAVTGKPIVSLRNAVWLIAFLVLICVAMLVWVLQLRRALIPSSAPIYEPISGSHSRLLAASAWLAKLAAAGSLIVLIGGWCFHIRVLILMRENTALCLTLLTASAWLASQDMKRGSKRILYLLCAGTSAAIGLLTLAEYLTGVHFGFDSLFRGPAAQDFSGRMAIAAALCISLLGVGALLQRYTRRILAAQSMILIAGSICQLNAIGLLYGVRDLFGVALQQGTSQAGAVAGLMISMALLLSNPASGFMRTVSSDGPGGILVRRLLPAAILVPAALGWLRWKGQLSGLYGTSIGVTLFAYANIIAFSLLIWTTASLLNRLELERQHAQSQGRIAEEANRAKTEFLTVMSHEIRTPMNAVLGMADVLMDSPLDATQRHYVDVLRGAGSNLMTLINDLLDLSKIEAGKLELEHIEFDLKALIDQTVGIMETSARAKGLALKIDWAPGTPKSVIGDPLRVRQVLLNLLGNAVKFTEKGFIQVSVRSAPEPPGRIQFAVSDTGIGIPEDKLEAIFGSFTQADAATTRKYGGTGLGLSISRRLVELMGGRISVTSSPGKGSTFQFTVALQRADEKKENVAAGAERVPSEHKATQPLRILIAEDSPDSRLLLNAYLQGADHRVIFVEHGRQAIEKFETEKFDLVLMDMHMPVMDGFTATRALRQYEQEHNLPRTPIIAITANARPEDIRATRAAGCDAHLSKPVSKGSLLAAIEIYGRQRKNADRIDMQERIKIKVPAGLDDLTPQYLDDRRSEFANLDQALRRSDFQQIRTIAHNLKGTGSSYGFEELTTLGAAMEISAKQENAGALKKQLAALEEYLNNVELSKT